MRKTGRCWPMRSVAGLVALAVFSGSADAARWWHIQEKGSPPGRVEEFVDADSIRPTGAGTKLIMIMLVTEQPFAQGLNAMRGLYEIDCKRRRSRSVARVAINPSGAQVGRVDGDPLPWARDHPGSFASAAQALVCRGRVPDDAVAIDSLDPQVVARAYFAENGNYQPGRE